MKDITIKFNIDDVVLKDALVETFGEDVDFYESKGFDGSEFIFVAIIPIAALTVQVIDFFITHFSQNKGSKRVIIKNDREVSIENYSAKDVKSILETIIDISDEHDED